MKQKSYLCLWDWLLLALPSACLVFSILLFTYKSSNAFSWKAVMSLKIKKIDLAIDYFSQALNQNPLSPYHHLNLALAYDLNKQPEKANHIYPFVAYQFPQSQIRYFSYFNQGELYGRLKSMDKALKFYQKALDLELDQQKIKHNIELLFLNQKNQSDTKNKDKDKKKSKKQGDQQDDQKQDQDAKQNQNQKEDQNNKDQNNKQDQKEKQQESQNNKQEQNKKQDAKQKDLKSLSPEQEQAILKAMDQKEKEARQKSKAGKQKKFRRRGGKDW